MKYSFKRATCMLLPFLLALFSNIVISKESIKFSFLPGEQISFVQQVTVIKEKNMGDLGSQLDESLLKTKITITRTNTGFDLISTPISAEMKRGGKVINNPITSLLLNAKIKYKLDPTGKLIDVEGYEALIENFSKSVPSEVFKKLAPVLSVESLKAKAVMEYNGRLGDFIGAEFKVGDSFNSRMPFQLPNGTKINYDVKTTISSREACGANSCIRIEQDYDSKADNLAKISGELINDISKTIEPKIKQTNSAENKGSIKGSISRLIDPATMLIYEENVTRIVDMEINIPNAGLVPVKVTESRAYIYQY